MGHHDAGDAFARCQRIQYSLHLSGQCRTGVDDRNRPFADQVSVGATKGHRRRVGGQYPKDVILHAVFFYVQYAVSYRDLEEIME